MTPTSPSCSSPTAVVLALLVLFAMAPGASAMAPRPKRTPWIDVEKMLEDAPAPSSGPTQAPRVGYRVPQAYVDAERARYLNRDVWFRGRELRLSSSDFKIGTTRVRPYRKARVLRVEAVAQSNGDEAIAIELQHEDGATGWLVGAPDYAYSWLDLTDPKKAFGWSREAWASIDRQVVRPGMTDAQVTLSWGPPDKVNRTITAAGTSEQWIFRKRDAYLYFENHVLTTIQDSR